MSVEIERERERFVIELFTRMNQDLDPLFSEGWIRIRSILDRIRNPGLVTRSSY